MRSGLASFGGVGVETGGFMIPYSTISSRRSWPSSLIADESSSDYSKVELEVTPSPLVSSSPSKP